MLSILSEVAVSFDFARSVTDLKDEYVVEITAIETANIQDCINVDTKKETVGSMIKLDELVQSLRKTQGMYETLSQMWNCKEYVQSLQKSFSPVAFQKLAQAFSKFQQITIPQSSLRHLCEQGTKILKYSDCDK